MTQYIDKSALITEIKRRIDRNNEDAASYSSNSEHDYLCRVIERVYKNLLSFLDTIETKEVDLEKEVEDWVKTGPHTSYPWCTIPDAIRITAEHFFELGLNTQKGE